MTGQYNDPVRIVCFSTAEGSSQDVTEDVAREIKTRAERTGEELSPGLRDFIEYNLALARRVSAAQGAN
jgi:hypothetical protein